MVQRKVHYDMERDFQIQCQIQCEKYFKCFDLSQRSCSLILAAQSTWQAVYGLACDVIPDGTGLPFLYELVKNPV